MTLPSPLKSAFFGSSSALPTASFRAINAASRTFNSPSPLESPFISCVCVVVVVSETSGIVVVTTVVAVVVFVVTGVVSVVVVVLC